MTSSATAESIAEARGVWTVELRPRDPLLVRDARPFPADPGARAVSLDWPLPATIAGALRTHIGTAIGLNWSRDDDRKQVREIAVCGPFLVRRDDLGIPLVYFAAPRDAVPFRTDNGEPALLRLRPVAPGALPAEAGSDLWPGLQPVRVEREIKPSTGPAFWSETDIVAWLADPHSTTPPRQPCDRLPTDVRTHVAIDPATRTQVEGALFSTEALAFDPRRAATSDAPAEALLCRVIGAPATWRPTPVFVPLGGEGRQAELAPALDGDPWPRPTPDLIRQLNGTRRLRLQLVTPGLFARSWQDAAHPAPPGWLPEWIDAKTLEGRPPRWSGSPWRLVSAVVGRRVALSGWDMAWRDPRTARRGRPKRTRYAVPAGSVYFFELSAPLTAEDARALWLRPVSDRLYDRNNGFGVVLPGVWEAWDSLKEGS